LNRVDPNHYQDANGNPWDGALQGCENDARDMLAIARKRGFKSQLLLNEHASAQAVADAIKQAAQQLKKGDILLLTYSGHGGQVPDRNKEEKDQLDETWCLYDRQLIDDELYALWARFAKGVRILMLSDSCHSGTVSRDPMFPTILASANVRARLLPADVQARTYKAHKKEYDQIQKDNPAGDKAAAKLGATVVLLSGCQDNQFSSDGDQNGLFTATLLKVWNKGRFKSSLTRFHRNIKQQMPLWQSPNYFVVGSSNPAFESQRPFSI
jgi:hypothetical protein